MNLQIKDDYIPGTKLLRSEAGGAIGLEFLSKIFFVSDGVMLNEIREVSGIDGSTLQNWTKRGWVANSKLKRYDINQFAHILIINMLRSCMQLDKIASLIEYINGDIDDRSDDIIADSVLYDYICRILENLRSYEVSSLSTVKDEVNSVTSDYVERFPGARERLVNALEIIVVAYCATIIKKYSDSMLDSILA